MLYCTYFDAGYLPRALTLIDSLRRAGDTTHIHVLALDDETADYLEQAQLVGVGCISLDDIEAWEERLLPLKSQRSRAEYIFTLTPHLIRYCIERFAESGELVAYLDADMAFFASGKRVADALGSDSVGIIPHRYVPRLETKLSKYGTYNVGWLGFRNTVEGNAVLSWYSNATIDWCFDTPDEGRYADQGYLDQFVSMPGVRILSDSGFNLAPWNVERHFVTKAPDGPLLVDGGPLVFFHFHGLRKWNAYRYQTAEINYGARLAPLVRDAIYLPYVESLEQNTRVVAEALPVRAKASRRGHGFRGVAFSIVRRLQGAAAIILRSSVKIPADALERST